MPLPICLFLKWSSIVTDHQWHIKVIMVVQALQVFVSAWAAAKRQGRLKRKQILQGKQVWSCYPEVFSPVPQSHQCIFVQLGHPLLAVSTDRCLRHAQRLHTIGAGVVSDVIVQLVGCYHPRGDGEAPWCIQRSRSEVELTEQSMFNFHGEGLQFTTLP